MGDLLPFVDVAPGLPILALTTQANHACAVLEGGRVKCWGNNYEGELGLGDPITRGISYGQMGDSLPFVNLGESVKAVTLASGYEHTCALLEGGQVKCWGTNQYGQLGLGDQQGRGSVPGQMGDALPFVDLGNVNVVSLVAGSYHTCALLEGGQVKCWGRNDKGTLGLEDVQDRGGIPGQMG
jgi:alpha-tubulin suppressor-like RCC1 family protein